MSRTVTCAVLLNALLFLGCGTLLLAWPVGLCKAYVDASLHDAVHAASAIINVAARALGTILVLFAAVLLMSCIERVSSPEHRRGVLAFGSVVQLCWCIVLALSRLGDSASYDTTSVSVACAVPMAALVSTCLVLMFDMYSCIPADPQPQQPQPQHTINADEHDDDEAGEGGEGGEADPLLEAQAPAGEGPEGEGSSGWMRLLALAKPESRILAAGCIALLVRLPFSLSIPHFVAETIGCLQQQDPDYSEARFNALLLLVAGTVDAILDFWNFFLFGYAQQRLVRRLRSDLFMTFLRQEVGYYDATSSGDATSRLQVDTAEMGNDLTWVFRWTIESVGRIVGVIVYMFVREWRLALAVVAVIPFCAAVGKVYGDWLQKNAEKVQTSLAASNAVAQEVLSAIRTVYSFNNQRHESKRYDKEVGTWYRLNVKQVFMQSIYYMVIATFLINTCVQAMILFYGVYLAQHQNLSPTVLTAFMLYQGTLQQWVSSLLNCFTNLIKSTGAGAKVFKILDREPKMQPQGGASDVLINEMSEISFDDVRFTYPTRDEPVLRGVSLSAPPGTVVALVGLSGAGKSTLFHLLERFYEPSSGRVTLGGVDLATIPPHEIHSKIAIVGQEPVLFSGSVFSNIIYSVLHEGGDADDTLLDTIEANPDVKAEFLRRARAAADIANATEFIDNLPDGFATEVGEKGVMLSGGQKQRVAIARALMQDPKILLLDEATSALDAKSEMLVQQALDKASQGRTTIVIAHRLSTVVRANQIFVLDKGVVVEHGTHADLMRKEDAPEGEMSYRRLVERQTLQSVGDA